MAASSTWLPPETTRRSNIQIWSLDLVSVSHKVISGLLYWHGLLDTTRTNLSVHVSVQIEERKASSSSNGRSKSRLGSVLSANSAVAICQRQVSQSCKNFVRNWNFPLECCACYILCRHIIWDFEILTYCSESAENLEMLHYIMCSWRETREV